MDTDNVEHYLMGHFEGIAQEAILDCILSF
jgi:hypothetical protein